MTKHRLLCLNVSALLLAAVGCGTARLPLPDEVTWMRQSSQRLAKAASHDLRHRPERLQVVQYRYDDLASSGNAYLSEVQAALDFESLLMAERRQHLRKMARIVASRYAQFVIEADAGRTPDAVVTVGEKVGGLVDGLEEELDELLEDRSAESRKTLRARLEEEKWKPWERVSGAAPVEKSAAVPKAKAKTSKRRARPASEAQPELI